MSLYFNSFPFVLSNAPIKFLSSTSFDFNFVDVNFAVPRITSTSSSDVTSWKSAIAKWSFPFSIVLNLTVLLSSGILQ